MRSKSVLVVEDDENSADLLSTFARSEGFVASIASSLAQARQQLIVHKPGIVLLDLGLPDGSGMDLFSDENLRGDAEIVLITGNASVDTSVQALRLGAADYLIKPVSLKLLRTVLTRLADAPPRGSEPPQLDAGAPEAAGEDAPPVDKAPRAVAMSGRAADNFGGMWGISQAMQDVFTQIERVARTSVSVFIVGESGTGKELVAESIHRFSHRKNGPFEAVNCGAISAQLIESELFGHEKGSFTGAIKQHKGFFERASGGTLFLDEITEMSLDLQVKLLRVLETGTFSRVGSDSPLRSDVRVVAATNRQPLTAVREGKLREDLYYRLNVFQIGLPPLRDRLEDLPLVARHFLAAYARREGRSLSITDAALKAMCSYHWPGNVRELRNYVHRTAIMVDDKAIDLDSLPPFDAQTVVGAGTVAERYPATAAEGTGSRAVAQPATAVPVASEKPAEADRAAGSPASAAHGAAVPLAGTVSEMPVVPVRVGSTIADAERDLIIATLDYCGGAKERTADMLGISLKTLYNRLRAYGSD
ncbi:MAG: sigma-54-dependent Fis family transcriptional regulator [Lautropia sp.]|nr:sigma-54-dependent Fis family transcriptional regulator [Lautropia sp.]